MIIIIGRRTVMEVTSIKDRVPLVPVKDKRQVEQARIEERREQNTPKPKSTQRVDIRV